jgi:hypothetical protein
LESISLSLPENISLGLPERISLRDARRLGEERPDEFFRDVVEPMSDSFDPAQVAAYEAMMQAWIPARAAVTPVVPERVERVYVLSRVTLGSDIKITSVIIDAMRRRFPDANVIFVGGRKSAELFRVGHLEAAYPRSGPVSARLEFARSLELDGLVVDPDSRISQLGLIPIGKPEHYFHFNSRVANSSENLSDLTNDWLEGTFGLRGRAFIDAEPVPIEPGAAAVSLGVGENETKRIPGEFETLLIRELGARFPAVWVDRGVGGEEARRVTEAVQASGVADRIRFWEGSFAGFASIISQSALYCGYDSAGQHAAAACGTPLITFFAGAPSERFVKRWAPKGPGPVRVIMETAWTSDGLKSLLKESFG